jgi:hypothetical protein
MSTFEAGMVLKAKRHRTSNCRMADELLKITPLPILADELVKVKEIA